MSEHADGGQRDSTGIGRPERVDGSETVESYEVENGVVFYDSENPLAWMEASSTVLLQEYA
ncbi:hypothetical protein ACFQJD_04510 [Haloplanus sp. GCM10025708]|uniref:DUF7331 family protein n=1 Tax=Haloferacaceae TaxID=1644056 RepID=UPI00361B6631